MLLVCCHHFLYMHHYVAFHLINGWTFWRNASFSIIFISRIVCLLYFLFDFRWNVNEYPLLNYNGISSRLDIEKAFSENFLPHHDCSELCGEWFSTENGQWPLKKVTKTLRSDDAGYGYRNVCCCYCRCCCCCFSFGLVVNEYRRFKRETIVMALPLRWYPAPVYILHCWNSVWALNDGKKKIPLIVQKPAVVVLNEELNEK